MAKKKYADKPQPPGSRFAFHPWAEEDKSAQYECDGCGAVVSGARAEKEEKQIIEHKGWKPHCKDHMGYMQVGGPAWHAYHDKGEHPMTSIVNQVRDLSKKFSGN